MQKCWTNVTNVEKKKFWKAQKAGQHTRTHNTTVPTAASWGTKDHYVDTISLGHTATHTYTFSHSGPWHTLRVIRFSTSGIFTNTIYPQRNPKEIWFSSTSVIYKHLSFSLSLSLLNYALTMQTKRAAAHFSSWQDAQWCLIGKENWYLDLTSPDLGL